MDPSTFDPTRAIAFDLARGQVTREGAGAVLLLPAEILGAVCDHLGASVARQLGAALGQHAGARVRARVGQGVAPSVELMVEQLAGELALAGLGAFALERWGQALVARIDGHPLGAHAEQLLGGYVEGALLAAVERELTALPLERAPRALRLLLCSKGASVKVERWMLSGASWGDALAALHGTRQDVAGGRA